MFQRGVFELSALEDDKIQAYIKTVRKGQRSVFFYEAGGPAELVDPGGMDAEKYGYPFGKAGQPDAFLSIADNARLAVGGIGIIKDEHLIFPVGKAGRVYGLAEGFVQVWPVREEGIERGFFGNRYDKAVHSGKPNSSFSAVIRFIRSSKLEPCSRESSKIRACFDRYSARRSGTSDSRWR